MDNTKNAPPLAVTQAVTLELIDASGVGTPIEAELQYDSKDPYAVTTVFITGTSRVRWTFGRELLSVGLYEPTGDGDVHVWPCLDTEGRAVVIVELCSPDGEALIQARTGDLTSFMDRIDKAVPIGTEHQHVNVDAAITAILAAETS